MDFVLHRAYLSNSSSGKKKKKKKTVQHLVAMRQGHSVFFCITEPVPQHPGGSIRAGHLTQGQVTCRLPAKTKAKIKL